MLIYGVCVSDIKHYNTEKAEKFLNSLLDTACRGIADNYFENKADGNDLYDWLDGYDSCDGYSGPAACFKEIIRELEGIDVDCDDPNGDQFLGISADAPWHFNEKTRNLSKEEFHEILSRYVSYFTDDELGIRWWRATDVCEY